MPKSWPRSGEPWTQYWGAKAGIRARADAENKRDLLASFARLAKPLLHSVFFTGPDMGTTYEDIEFLFRESGTDTIAFVRSKMAEKGIEVDLPDDIKLSSLEGEGITGWGVTAATEEACSILGLQLSETRIAVQGFGSVGYSTARYLREKGARIVAVADRSGVICAEDGLDVEVLKSATDGLGNIDRERLPREANYELLPGDAWLKKGAEIIIPAAVPDALDEANAREIEAKLVVEAANIPTTRKAREILAKRGVALAPDYIANAGMACGFGLVITGQVRYDLREVFQEVSQRVRKATSEFLKH